MHVTIATIDYSIVYHMVVNFGEQKNLVKWLSFGIILMIDDLNVQHHRHAYVKL